LCNLTRNFTQSKVYISEINDLFSAYREAFSETEILIAQWHYGQILFFSSKFTESFEVYHGLYSRINIRETMRWYVFMAEYFRLCLVTGHYDIGEEICRDYFIKFFDDKNGSFYLSALIQCVKLLIHTNQFELAQQKLEELNKLTTKSSSLQFQFALRELTVAYYYLSGNFKEALSLAEKNLKFMRSKRMHYLIPEYTYHARLTKAFVKRKLKNKPLTSEDELMFDAMQKGTMAQYGILLKKLADA
jgi:tetratricopeptide (TPR) repeat protein